MARKVRPYRRKTAGTRCRCFVEPVPRCTTCYGTGIVGGYEEGDVIFAVESGPYLMVKVSDLVFVPGDAFIYKKVKRVVVDAQSSWDGNFFLLDYRNVELSNPLASFPMKEAT